MPLSDARSGFHPTWLPPYNGHIDCIEEDNEKCESIENFIEIDDEVDYACTDTHCSFQCRDFTQTINVEIITCEGKKWQMSKTIKKKGVFCTDENDDNDKKKDKKKNKDKNDKKKNKNKNKNKEEYEPQYGVIKSKITSLIMTS